MRVPGSSENVNDFVGTACLSSASRCESDQQEYAQRDNPWDGIHLEPPVHEESRNSLPPNAHVEQPQRAHASQRAARTCCWAVVDTRGLAAKQSSEKPAFILPCVWPARLCVNRPHYFIGS